MLWQYCAQVGTWLLCRDIKPQNLLVNINTHALKLCDFGSAKALIRGEPNISYICSRYYRAPELIFGAVDYTVAIDVSRVEGESQGGRLWQQLAGCCVLANCEATAQLGVLQLVVLHGFSCHAGATAWFLICK